MNKLRIILCTLLMAAQSLQATQGYILNFGNSTILTFDESRDVVTGQVNDPNTLINGPEYSAITPDGTKMYVTSQTNSTVNIINISTNTVTGNVNPNGFPFNAPFFVIITPDGKTAYVGNTSTVSIIDVATDTVMGYVNDTLHPFNFINYMAISPDGTKMYVTNAGTNSVVVVDIVTNTVTGIVNPNGFPFSNPADVVFLPNGIKAYVASNSNNSVRIIDVASNTVIGTVSGTFTNPFVAAVALDGTKLYVSNSNNQVSVVNTANDTVVNTIAVTNDDDNNDITINPENTKLYLPDATTSIVNIVAIASDTFKGIVSDPNSMINEPEFVDFVPVSVVSGCKQKNVFLTQTENFNVITWPASGVTPLYYNIFRDAALTQLVGSTESSVLQFIDHNRKANVAYTYYVVAVYPTTTAFVGSVTVTEKCVRDCCNSCSNSFSNSCCSTSCSNSCSDSCTKSCK